MIGAVAAPEEPIAGRTGARRRFAGTCAVVAVAGSAWVGAVVAAPVSRWWPAGVVVVLVVARRHLPLFLKVVGAALVIGLVAAGLAASAWSGLDAPVPSVLEGRVTLVGDPRPTRFGVWVEARADGRLWDLTASDGAAGVLGGLRAGESVWVRATPRAREPDDVWRASRHVAGTAAVAMARDPTPAGGPWKVANAIHRALLRSTDHLPADARGVAVGVALGDRGLIDGLLAEDLRAAGLSHLTAVSGQHVALLVGMAAPLVSRLSRRTGFLVTMVMLGGFVILTRGEPSVLRAAAMAVVVVTARAVGRRPVALRVLAAVVAVLVLVDPLIVWSVGFQLSVAATAGIAAGATRLSAAIPGPRLLAAALGVSLAAQAAVAPFVVIHFGVMPLIGIVANLAVVPVIGPLMGWTLLAGVTAGVVPALAVFLHTPTSMLAGWVAAVARWSAGIGVPGVRMGDLGAGLLVALAGSAVCVAAGVRTRRRWVTAAGLLGAMVILVVAALGGGGPPVGRHALGTGAEAVVGDGRVALVIDGRAGAGGVVGELRRLGVRRVDVVVARSGATATVGVVEAVAARFDLRLVAVPSGAPMGAAHEGGVGGVRVVAVDGRWEVPIAPMQVVVTPDGTGRLDVTVSGPE